MKIELSMVRWEGPLCVDREGDALRINGALLDLSGISEGDVLPANAVDCRWIGGEITRSGGVLNLMLFVPYGPVAPGSAVPDRSLTISGDGAVDLGCDDGGRDFQEGTVVVDWSRLVTETTRRDGLRADAMRQVDVEHADLLRRLTGNATIEERDTWTVKEAAARAQLDGTATDSQQQMLAMEAEGRQQSVNALASIIVAKADQFRVLVGLTSKLRAAARAGVEAATDAGVLIADVPVALAAAEAQRAADRQAAIAAL